MQPANTSLKTAYDRVRLALYGVSFDDALAKPMFRKCLERIADATQEIKQPPLPKHKTDVHWQDFRD